MINSIGIKNNYLKKLKNIKLLVTDIDGTLLKDNGTIGTHTKQLLEKVYSMGIHIAIATGRSQAALPEIIYKMPCFEYVITGNGTSIYYIPERKLIYDCKMPAVLAAKIIDVFIESGFQMEVVIEGRAYVSDEYYNNPLILNIPQNMVKYVQSTRFPTPDIYKLTQEHIDDIESLVLVIDDINEKRIIRNRVEQFENIYVTTSVDHYIECNHIEARKGRTMEKLGRMLGVSIDEIIAFGDSENDLDMIECAGIGVAMGNASEDVKKKANIITSDNNSEGIAAILEQMIELKENGEI